MTGNQGDHPVLLPWASCWYVLSTVGQSLRWQSPMAWTVGATPARFVGRGPGFLVLGLAFASEGFSLYSHCLTAVWLGLEGSIVEHQPSPRCGGPQGVG